MDDYVEVFSNRDVPEILAVETPARLEALRAAGGRENRTGRNDSKLSSELGLAVTTIRRWSEALNAAIWLNWTSHSRNSGSTRH